MPETRTIVCLANSRRLSGRSIAGKEILADGYGKWIRPASIENYVIDAEYYWVKNNELSWSDVKRLVDKPAAIWTNNHSTYDGLNDRVKIDIAARLNTSLMLI